MERTCETQVILATKRKAGAIWYFVPLPFYLGGVMLFGWAIVASFALGFITAVVGVICEKAYWKSVERGEHTPKGTDNE